MKRILFVLISLLMTVSACSAPKLVKVENTSEPSAVLVPSATSVPTVEPVPTNTALPTNTAVPPTAEPSQVPPTDIPPTEVPATEVPQEANVVESVLFFDRFDAEDERWNTGEWSDGVGDDIIAGGFYQMNLHADNQLIWSETFDVGSDNLVMEVDTLLNSGTMENAQGLICRLTDVNNFYLLMIGNDGWYFIDKYVEDMRETLISGFAPEGVISPEFNQIQARCDGTNLSLTVNDELVAEVEDDSHPSGEVALAMQSYDEGEVSISFDNFIVYDAAIYDDVYFMPMNLAFSDDFSADNYNWMTGDFQQLTIDLADGSLNYKMKIKDWVVWDAIDNLTFQDVLLRASFENVNNSTETVMGFICRYVDDANFYYIAFGNDNRVQINAMYEGEWITLFDETVETDAINLGLNQAKASCIGNQFELYVNDVLIAEASDPDNLFTHGGVGITAGAYDELDVIISIDDFEVLTYQ